MSEKSYLEQLDFSIRCEWGRNGLEALRPHSDLVIIIDVLSFSTCVEIATARGATVLPYEFKDDSAMDFARSQNAILAHPKRTPDKFSLSPRSLLNINRGERLVLPSPNGSTLSRIAGVGRTVTACLRNATAVASYASQFNTVALIPAGEKWSNGTLRPCFEDLVGAGAIISHLNGKKSPESLIAQSAFESSKMDSTRLLKSCASGMELIERNHLEDVEIASELNISNGVPILIDREYKVH